MSTSIDPNDKVEIYEELRSTKREGVVFKEVDAPYSAGRPKSGGTQLKYTFVESASFMVSSINSKRSVTLCLFDKHEDEPLWIRSRSPRGIPIARAEGSASALKSSLRCKVPNGP